MKISEDQAKEALSNGADQQPWALGRAPHLCRIFNIFSSVSSISGPCLDIGSGGAAFYKILRDFAPHLLPYACADFVGGAVSIEGEVVPVHPFTCDRDRLPLESQSVGLVLFCDVLEHLIVDPVWTLLEINRVLKPGAHFVLSTPNAHSFDRVLSILKGIHPGTENHYKPTSIYDRHNREWTPGEITECVSMLGFKTVTWDSNLRGLSPEAQRLLMHFCSIGLIHLEDTFFGPDLVFVFQKSEHLTIDTPLDKDRRWPVFLYTGYDCYRQRPSEFPKI